MGEHMKNMILITSIKHKANANNEAKLVYEENSLHEAVPVHGSKYELNQKCKAESQLCEKTTGREAESQLCIKIPERKDESQHRKSIYFCI